MDDTAQKIIDATMELITEKGYVATTTKDIASRAQINECTIFRKFKSKRDIVISGIDQEKWRPNVTSTIFRDVKWDLRTDLELFMSCYLKRITPDFVNLSIGLRAPQIKKDTLPHIQKIPEAFLQSLVLYFEKMHELGKIGKYDYNCLALTIFSSIFGFTFLKASFGERLSKVTQQEYIEKGVDLFLKGIQDEQ